MSELDLNIRYKPGRCNTNADTLSRSPLDRVVSPDNPEVVVANVGDSEDDRPPEARLAEMVTLQEVREMTVALETGESPDDEKQSKRLKLELPQLSMVDGVLWYVDSEKGCRPRLVVPKSLRHDLMVEIYTFRSLCWPLFSQGYF